MRINRKKLIITATVAVLLLAIAAASKPGRKALGSLYSMLGGKTAASPALPAGPDVEQRARSKHGWTNVITSTLRGTITYFDPNGAIARRANVTIYQKHPDRLRVDIEQDGLIISQGFSHGEVWQARAESLTEEAERDIRAWLRLFPERLFLVRGAGASYREVGRHLEDSRPGSPGRGPSDVRPARELDEVEIEDVIGPPASNPTRLSDRRMITYLIDPETSIVHAARWMEPDDPTEEVTEGANVATKVVRVDYAGWRRVEGVLWPMEVTHWLGGRVDFRVDVKDVLVNQQLADTSFRDPSR